MAAGVVSDRLGFDHGRILRPLHHHGLFRDPTLAILHFFWGKCGEIAARIPTPALSMRG